MPTTRQPRTRPVVEDLKRAMQQAIDGGTITVAELAEKTQLSRMQIYRILDGKSAPTLENADRIARALGGSISYIPA